MNNGAVAVKPSGSGNRTASRSRSGGHGGHGRPATVKASKSRSEAALVPSQPAKATAEATSPCGPDRSDPRAGALHQAPADNVYLTCDVAAGENICQLVSLSYFLIFYFKLKIREKYLI